MIKQQHTLQNTHRHRLSSSSNVQSIVHSEEQIRQLPVTVKTELEAVNITKYLFNT